MRIYPAAPQLDPYGEGGVGDLNYVVNQAQLISLISAALGLVLYPCSSPAKLLDAIKAYLPLHGQQQLTDLIRLPIQRVAAGIVVTQARQLDPEGSAVGQIVEPLGHVFTVVIHLEQQARLVVHFTMYADVTGQGRQTDRLSL